MSPVQYLAGFQCPSGGLPTGKGQVIYWNQDVYISNCSKFVYIYNIDKKLLKAVYLFPAEVWHIELVSHTRQLYVLCARSGIYLLTWDEQGRLLKEPHSAGSADVFSVGLESALLQDPSICKFTVAQEVLVIVSLQLKKWKIKLFQTGFSHGKDSILRSFREVECSMKPAVGQHLGIEDNDYHPVLCCVSLWKAGELSGPPCNLSIASSLFTSLFGVDSALLHSPVIVCGLPDGQIVFFPLKAAGYPYTQYAETKNLPPTKAMVLYHLEQPVVFIGATRTEMGADESQPSTNNTANLSCDCLVILGHNGLMVTVMSSSKTEDKGYKFRENHLQVPVLCAASFGSGVYYSTCSDLLLVNAPSGMQEESGTSKTLRHHPVLPCTSHNIPMVVAMSLIPSGPEGDARLLALSSRGKLMLCSLGHGADTMQWEGMSSAKAGQRIKDLLSGIGTVSERVLQLKSVIDQRNSSLFHLNQVMALSRAVLSSPGSELTVHFKVRVLWTHELQQDCLVASCTLENKTDCSFHRGWKLCIHVSSEASDSRTSYSFPVDKLLPGEKTDLSFPLSTARKNSMDFPITISCSLFYSLKGFVTDHISPVIPANDSMSLPHTQGICLPLQDHTIDILHCLRVQSQAGHPPYHASDPISYKDPIEVLLNGSAGEDSNIGKLRTHPEALYNQGVNSASPLTASVQVSAKLLNQTLKNKSTGVSLCCAVMQWLLSTELKNQTEMQVLTPDGKELCLRTREVSVSDLSFAGPIPAVEIQIVSSHLDALACLHLAVLSRLQSLVLQDNANDCDTQDLNMATLKQLFTTRELLLKEVQALRDRLCVEKELISDAAAQRLLHIYRELRDPNLLLL